MNRTVQLLLLAISVAALSAIEVAYELKTGWNLISVPCIPEGESMVDIFPHVPPAYVYNSETMGYEELTALPQPNQGLWMLVSEDTTLTLECTTHWPEEPLSEEHFMVIEPELTDSIILVDEVADGFLIGGVVRSDGGLATAVPRLCLFRLDESGVPISGQKFELGKIIAMKTLAYGGSVVVADGSEPGTGIVFFRLDSDGEVQWAKAIAATTVSDDIELVELPEDYLIFKMSSYILKLNADGVVIWGKDYGRRCFSVYPRSDGSMTGLFEGEISTSSFPILVNQISSHGVPTTTRSFYSGEMTLFSNSYMMEDSSIVVVTNTLATEGSVRSIIYKVSPEASLDWAKAISSPDSMEIGLKDIAESDAGSILLAGNGDADTFAACISSAGEFQWAQTYIGNAYGPDDPEKALAIYSGGEGINVFGIKKYCDSLPYILSFQIDSAGENCLSTPVALSIVDYTMGISSETVTALDFGLMFTDIDVEHEPMEVDMIELCR